MASAPACRRESSWLFLATCPISPFLPGLLICPTEKQLRFFKLRQNFAHIGIRDLWPVVRINLRPNPSCIQFKGSVGEGKGKQVGVFSAPALIHLCQFV